MIDIKHKLEQINECSNSLERLRLSNSSINERLFHEHTHILYDIRTFLGTSPVNYVEIGSYVGSSARLMLSHELQTNVTCIDPLCLPPSHYRGEKDQHTTLLDNLNSGNIHERDFVICKHRSDDIDAIDSVSNIDILHIDGSHQYDAVIKDFNLYEDKVNTNGFIIFDDYHDYRHSPQVKPAVDKIVSTLSNSQYEVIGCLNNFHNIATESKSTYSNFILCKKP